MTHIPRHGGAVDRDQWVELVMTADFDWLHAQCVSRAIPTEGQSEMQLRTALLFAGPLPPADSQ